MSIPVRVRDVPAGTLATWQGFQGVVEERVANGGAAFFPWELPPLVLRPDDEIEVLDRKQVAWLRGRYRPKRAKRASAGLEASIR